MEENKFIEKENLDPKTLTPSEYFEKLKDAKNDITVETIKNSFDTILHLAEKYKKLGQKRSLGKLKYLTEILKDEEKLIEFGITTFIYRDTIEDYIDHVDKNVVKIIELENYMREIPDELVEVIEKTKDIFTNFYIVFTDYTGKEERRVETARKEKDPILFGCFQNREYVADRFYFLGDWIDEYCDLTLDKLVEKYKVANNGNSPTHFIETPQTTEELIKIMNEYVEVPNKEDSGIGESFVLKPTPEPEILKRDEKKNKSFFGKVRSVFKK